MKIWQIQIPFDSGFAELLSIYQKPEIIRCSHCMDAVEPDLLVEWEDGSDIVADFTSASGRIVVKESVADELLAEFNGIEKAPVRFFDDPRLYKPEKVSKRIPKRVWLPYEGPPLCELRVCKEVRLLEKSSVEIEERCEFCGSILYENFIGIEIKNSHEQIPRKKGLGLFFSKSELEDYDFFKPKYTGFFLCTETAKKFILDKQYSNVEFLEAGETESE